MVEWIYNNRQWIFEGIGVAVLVGIFTWIFKRRKSTTGTILKQKSGKNSINIQSGKNINLTGDVTSGGEDA